MPLRRALIFFQRGYEILSNKSMYTNACGEEFIFVSCAAALSTTPEQTFDARYPTAWATQAHERMAPRSRQEPLQHRYEEAMPSHGVVPAPVVAVEAPPTQVQTVGAVATGAAATAAGVVTRQAPASPYPALLRNLLPRSTIPLCREMCLSDWCSRTPKRTPLEKRC